MTAQQPTPALAAPEWLNRFPEPAKEAYAAGVAARGAYVDPAEVAAAHQQERYLNRQWLLGEQHQQRWNWWTAQVPRRYVDRERPLSYEGARELPAEAWLSRLAPEQFPEQIAAWLREREASTLVLAGPTGTGKTLAAVCAGYAAAAMGAHVVMESQLDYLLALRPGGSDDPGRVRSRAAGAGLLILDDLGAETEEASQFTRAEVCALLDERISQERRQIITTNLTPDQLIAAFGARIVSRLGEHLTAITYEGADRRVAMRALW